MSEPASVPSARPAHALIRAIVDYGGLVVFVAAYFLKLRLNLPHAGSGWSVSVGSAPDITSATLWLVAGSLGALLVGLAAERRLAPMPLISGGFAFVFGGLTLAFHDPSFIKMKPTVANGAFAVVLLAGLRLGRNPLKWLLGEALSLPDAAWRQLTVRYAVYFMAAAGLNEWVWRTQSNTTWVLFRMPGLLILVLIFSISQAPFLMRHMKTPEPAPPPTD